MPDWEVNERAAARDWGVPRFWVQAGLHNPGIVLARFDYAYDRAAAEGAEGDRPGPADLLATIDTNEAAIEATGVVQHSYTAPSDDHGILEWETFYAMEVGGVALVDWVEALIAMNHSTTSIATRARRGDRQRSDMQQEVVLAMLAKEPSHGYELGRGCARRSARSRMPSTPGRSTSR